MIRFRPRLRGALALLLAAAAATACAGAEDAPTTRRGPTSGDRSISVLTHGSWAMDESLLKRFTEETGIRVRIVEGDDAGAMLNQLILAKGAPIADAVYGIDSTFETRAVYAAVLEPYESNARESLRPELLRRGAPHLTPIDFGDVCINYDRNWFANHPEISVPESLDDLLGEQYRNLLVVQDPARSSPGLAFLLATIETYGADGWQGYWEGLVDNGVAVASGWDEAYNTRFTGSGADGADRPLVVSYGTSPPAALIYGEEGLTEPPIGVMEQSCYRQIEYAGVVRGTQKAAAAESFIDWMLSSEVQQAIPEQMFVLPAREGTPLTDLFEQFAAQPPARELESETISESRERWIDEWTDILG